jgi:hypothetical protein
MKQSNKEEDVPRKGYRNLHSAILESFKNTDDVFLKDHAYNPSYSGGEVSPDK